MGRKPKEDPLLCSKCKIKKTIEDFTKLKTGKLQSYCKECYRKRSNAQYHKDPAKHGKACKRYATAHKDEIASYYVEYRKKNAEKLNTYQRMYSKKNPDKVKVFQRAYRKRNVAEVNDAYVKVLLRRQYGIHANEATQELIETKKKKVKTWRTLKRLKTLSQDQ